jgi:hypothetical protein
MGSQTRKLARRSKPNPAKALGDAVQALERLQGVPELVAAIQSVGVDLKEVRQALSMAIQDMGEADHRFNRFRYAIMAALSQYGIQVHDSIPLLEAKYDKEVARDHTDQGSADVKDPA